jgi:hypothetical protein
LNINNKNEEYINKRFFSLPPNKDDNNNENINKTKFLDKKINKIEKDIISINKVNNKVNLKENTVESIPNKSNKKCEYNNIKHESNKQNYKFINNS